MKLAGVYGDTGKGQVATVQSQCHAGTSWSTQKIMPSTNWIWNVVSLSPSLPSLICNNRCTSSPGFEVPPWCLSHTWTSKELAPFLFVVDPFLTFCYSRTSLCPTAPLLAPRLTDFGSTTMVFDPIQLMAYSAQLEGDTMTLMFQNSWCLRSLVRNTLYPLPRRTSTHFGWSHFM